MAAVLLVVLWVAWLASVLILLLAILYAVKAGFNEVIKGLRSVDNSQQQRENLSACRTSRTRRCMCGLVTWVGRCSSAPLSSRWVAAGAGDCGVLPSSSHQAVHAAVPDSR